MTAITVTLSQTALISRIKAHIAKGDKAKDKAEQHYIAAGQYLKQLKDDCPDQKTFLEKVEKEIGIGKSRTYELMQIGDGRKTVEEVRADTAKRTANAKAGLKLSASSGQKAEPEAGDKAIKTEPDGKGEDKGFLVDANGAPISTDEAIFGKEGMAVFESMARPPEEFRSSVFDELQARYPDDYGIPIHETLDQVGIVKALVGAIGVERTRALGKAIPGLIPKAIGKGALPDCRWCSGSGLMEAKLDGREAFKVQCDCTHRKRGEDFNALQARLKRENEEKGIPKQDFAFGVEVRTKDGKIWASGVRLPTEEQAGFYFDYWARPELRRHGYKTWENESDYDLLGFDIRRYDEQPLMKIWGGKRKGLSFMHGTCGLLGPKGWQPISGGECSCKKCKADRAFWEKLAADDPEASAEAMKAKLAAADV